MLYRVVILLLALLLVSAPAMACTDFVVKAKDGTIVGGRSMDFGINDQAKVTVYPRGKQWRSEAPGSKHGLQWK